MNGWNIDRLFSHILANLPRRQHFVTRIKRKLRSTRNPWKSREHVHTSCGSANLAPRLHAQAKAKGWPPAASRQSVGASSKREFKELRTIRNAALSKQDEESAMPPFNCNTKTTGSNWPKSPSGPFRCFNQPPPFVNNLHDKHNLLDLSSLVLNSVTLSAQCLDP